MAARNINQIHNFISFIIRKERGAFITPAEIDNALEAGQLEVIEDYFKLYGMTQQIHDALNPVKVFASITTDASGEVNFGTNHLHLLPLTYTVDGSTISRIRILQDNEWVDALTSQLRPATRETPIARTLSTKMQIYPAGVYTVFISYIKRPEKPTFGYTQSGRTITYDPTSSTQIELGDAYVDKIIAKALAYLGINMNENDIIQFSNMQDAKTS